MEIILETDINRSVRLKTKESPDPKGTYSKSVEGATIFASKGDVFLITRPKKDLICYTKITIRINGKVCRANSTFTLKPGDTITTACETKDGEKITRKIVITKKPDPELNQ